MVYQKWQSYDVWFLRYGVLLRFLSFWTIFCPFNSLRTQKIKILKTMKKHPGDIIILHMCIINENLMIYRSWDMEHDTYFFVILDHFLPFYPTKSKFWKNERTPGDIIILQKRTKNHNHMFYCFCDIAHDRCNLYFSFWTIFALLPP